MDCIVLHCEYIGSAFIVDCESFHCGLHSLIGVWLGWGAGAQPGDKPFGAAAPGAQSARP